MGVSCLEFREDDGFGVATNKPMAKKKLKGSRVWLIGGIGKPRRYYLCYNFLADSVDERDGEFRYIISGQEGNFFKPPILLNDFSWFRDFMRSQQNFSLGLREIDEVYVAKFEGIMIEQGMRSLGGDERREGRGAGFGSAEFNREVEQAAVLFVTNEYKRRGWEVESVETKRCGYDLVCTKSRRREVVEVKGIRGNDLSFIITAGEVKQSRARDDFVLCVVSTALADPTLHRFTAEEFREKFVLEAISYRAFLKR